MSRDREDETGIEVTSGYIESSQAKGCLVGIVYEDEISRDCVELKAN